MNQGDLEDARDDCDAAIELNPKYLKVVMLFALLCLVPSASDPSEGDEIRGRGSLVLSSQAGKIVWSWSLNLALSSVYPLSRRHVVGAPVSVLKNCSSRLSLHVVFVA